MRAIFSDLLIVTLAGLIGLATAQNTIAARSQPPKLATAAPLMDRAAIEKLFRKLESRAGSRSNSEVCFFHKTEKVWTKVPGDYCHKLRLRQLKEAAARGPTFLSSDHLLRPGIVWIAGQPAIDLRTVETNSLKTVFIKLCPECEKDFEELEKSKVKDSPRGK